MRRFLFLIPAVMLLACCSARADRTNVDALLTFTNAVNGVTNGDTATINGSVRRFTNGTLAAASTWIQSTNVMGWAATNTWLQLATFTPPLVDRVYPTNTASLVIQGALDQALTVTLSAGIGTVVYSTQIWSSVSSIVGPNGSVPTEAGRTNNVSRLFELMNDAGNRASNAVANGVRGLSNLLDRISHQTSSNKVFQTTTNIGGLSTNSHGAHGSNLVFTIFVLEQGRIVNLTNITGGLGSGFLVGGTFYSNVLAYVRGTNLQALHGTVFMLSDGIYVTPTLTNPVTLNLVNYGNAIRSEGPGGNSFQGGSNAVAYGALSVVIGNNGVVSNNNTIAVGINVQGLAPNSVIMGTGAAGLSNITANGYLNIYGANARATGVVLNLIAANSFLRGDNSTAIGNSFELTDWSSSILIGGDVVFGPVTNFVGIGPLLGGIANNAVSLGYRAGAVHVNSAALGPADDQDTGVTTTTTNQIRLGTDRQVASAPGFFSGTISNLNSAAGQTNVIGGDLSLSTATITTVANGLNRLNMGTNVILELTGSPSLDGWTIDGIVFGGQAPRNGHELRIVNKTGFHATFAHNSGLESTAAYRINCGHTATNRVFTNGATATLTYLTSEARWRLWDVSDGAPVFATATNVVPVFTNLAVFQTPGGTGLVINAQPAAGQSIVSVRTTNGHEPFQINSNNQTIVRGVTGRTENPWEVRDTNDATRAFVRTNGTLGASNLVQSPIGVPTGGGGNEVGVRWPLGVMTNLTGVTITNTTSATSWVTNALRGGQVMPANSIKPGMSIWMRGFGIVTSPSATVTTFGVRGNAGLNIVTNIVALPTTLVNDEISFEVLLTVRTTGASGSLMGKGALYISAATGGASALATRRLQSGGVASSVTIDTTVDNVFDFYISPGATTHGFTLQNLVMEVIP